MHRRVQERVDCRLRELAQGDEEEGDSGKPREDDGQHENGEERCPRDGDHDEVVELTDAAEQLRAAPRAVLDPVPAAALGVPVNVVHSQLVGADRVDEDQVDENDGEDDALGGEAHRGGDGDADRRDDQPNARQDEAARCDQEDDGHHRPPRNDVHAFAEGALIGAAGAHALVRSLRRPLFLNFRAAFDHAAAALHHGVKA